VDRGDAYALHSCPEISLELSENLPLVTPRMRQGATIYRDPVA